MTMGRSVRRSGTGRCCRRCNVWCCWRSDGERFCCAKRMLGSSDSSGEGEGKLLTWILLADDDDKDGAKEACCCCCCCGKRGLAARGGGGGTCRERRCSACFRCGSSMGSANLRRLLLLSMMPLLLLLHRDKTRDW